MKKSLILASVAALMLSTTMCFADTAPTLKNENTNTAKAECTCKKNKMPQQKAKRPSLDEKLKLTDEQKKQAQEQRKQSIEKMKPIIEKIKAKQEEIKTVAKSNLSDNKKEQKINALEHDILALKQQARKIRIENMKAFEALLTPEQKAEFEKIKKEGRERHKMKMNRMHKHHGPKQPLKQN